MNVIMNKHAIILAAGKGTRMHTDLPKCAYPFLGKPMVSYIVESSKKAGCDEVVVVVGYKREDIIKCLDNSVKFAVQEEQLGTGHAVKCAKNSLSSFDGITLIFPGDMPLIDTTTITELVKEHLDKKNALTVVTTVLEDAAKYGRIYRENGHIKKIVEFKDCTPEQLEIKEINSGLFCVDTKLLFEALDKVENHNNQHEYYLTDIVEIIGRDHQVDSYVVKDGFKLTGINDLDTLAEAEKIYLENQK